MVKTNFNLTLGLKVMHFLKSRTDLRGYIGEKNRSFTGCALSQEKRTSAPKLCP